MSTQSTQSTPKESSTRNGRPGKRTAHSAPFPNSGVTLLYRHWWSAVDGYFVLADGRVVPPEKAVTSATLSQGTPAVRHGRVWTAIRDHWWTGFNSAILFVDSIAIFLCLADWIRFQQPGRTLSDTWQFAGEAISAKQLLVWPSIVFVFFLIVLPVLTTFLSPALRLVGVKQVQTTKNTRVSGTDTHRLPATADTSSVLPSGVQSMSWLFNRLSRRRPLVFGVHLALSAGYFVFTLLAFSMETLSGWRKDEAVTYSFTSLWVFTVLWIKPFYSGLLLPVLKKFLVRRAGHEPTHFAEVLREVATEDHLKEAG